MPTSITPTYPNEKIYALTLEKLIPEISFEITRAQPLTARLFQTGCVEYYDSNAVKLPVELVDSPNISNVPLHGTYATAATNAPKAALFTHTGKKRGSFIVDKTELGQMGGKPQALIRANQQQVVESFAVSLERELIGGVTVSTHPSYDANAFNGLLSMLEARTEATQDYTVGGISKNTYANWRNRFATMSTFAVDGKPAWTQVYQQCSRLGSFPDTMLTDETVWRLYEETVAANVVLQAKEMAMPGFDNLMFRNAIVLASSEFANITYPVTTVLDGTIDGFTFFLTLRGEAVKEFGLSAEAFKTPGSNREYKGKGKGMNLYITRSDDFRVEGPTKMPNADVLQTDIILSGQMATRSLLRNGITKFTGSVQ